MNLAARPGTRVRDLEVELATRGLKAKIRLLELDPSVGASPGRPSQLRLTRLDAQRLREPERQPVSASLDILADGAERKGAAPESRYPLHDTLAEVVRPVQTGVRAPQQRPVLAQTTERREAGKKRTGAKLAKGAVGPAPHGPVRFRHPSRLQREA